MNNHSSYIPEPPAGINYMRKISSLIKVAKQLNKKPDYKEYFNKCSLNKIACVKVALNRAYKNRKLRKQASLHDYVFHKLSIKDALHNTYMNKSADMDQVYMDATGVSGSSPQWDMSSYLPWNWFKPKKKPYLHTSPDPTELPSSSAMHTNPDAVEDAAQQTFVEGMRPNAGKQPEISFTLPRGVPLKEAVPNFDSQWERLVQDTNEWEKAKDVENTYDKETAEFLQDPKSYLTPERIAEIKTKVNNGTASPTERSIFSYYAWKQRSDRLAKNPAVIDYRLASQQFKLPKADIMGIDLQEAGMGLPIPQAEQYMTGADLKSKISKAYNSDGSLSLAGKRLRDKGYLIPETRPTPGTAQIDSFGNLQWGGMRITPAQLTEARTNLSITEDPDKRWNLYTDAVDAADGKDYVDTMAAESWLPGTFATLGTGLGAVGTYKSLKGLKDKAGNDITRFGKGVRSVPLASALGSYGWWQGRGLAESLANDTAKKNLTDLVYETLIREDMRSHPQPDGPDTISDDTNTNTLIPGSAPTYFEGTSAPQPIRPTYGGAPSAIKTPSAPANNTPIPNPGLPIYNRNPVYQP